jgi:TatD DNase family protein
MYIDAHNHLDFYNENLKKALKIIQEKNILTLGCAMDEKSYLLTKKLSIDNPHIIPCFGIHPWKAHENVSNLDMFEGYIKECTVIGEVGLDYHWVIEKEKYPLMLKVFQFFLERAKQYNKVMNLHTKGAENEILEFIKQYDLRTPIIHWYSGGIEILKELIDCGCFFTVSVDAGYTKLTEEIVSLLPMNRILTETDGATSLQWVNGQYGYPSEVLNIVKYISHIKKLTYEETREAIYNNFNRMIYGK